MGQKLNPPMGSKLENPLKNGKVVKRAKAGRDRTYAKMGMRPLRTPLNKGA